MCKKDKMLKLQAVFDLSPKNDDNPDPNLTFLASHFHGP